MKVSNRLRIFVAAIVVPFVVSACFSSTPQRQESEGDGGGPAGGGSTSSGTPVPSSSPTSQMPDPGTRGQSSSRGQSSPNSTATAPQTGQVPTRTSRNGAVTGSSGESGRLEGQRGGEDGDADVRVASAQRPGAGTNNPDAPTADDGRPAGDSATTEDVGAAAALEAANAAVDAAAEAVAEAESTIERAREVVMTDAQGSGDRDSFDPWVTPGSTNDTSSNADGGQGGQPSSATSDGNDSAAPGEGTDEASGGDEVGDQGTSSNNDGPENFDPFAVINESEGQRGQPNRQQITAGSLQIADDALATANAALNRARRALIAAAGAGDGDADAEAVQMAAARAALEAAAEAVVASAIAVMAAAAGADPNAEPITDPAEIQRAMEEFARGVSMVVGVLLQDMKNAGETLEATADLLNAAGSLIAMVGKTEAAEPDQGEMSADERVAVLDQQLDKSLAVFDGKMNESGSSAAPGMSDAGDDVGGAVMGDTATSGIESDSNAAMANSRDGARGSGDNPQNRRAGRWADRERNADGRKDPTADGTKNEQFALEERGPAQDDDIVARQLREAAVAETDPELRERLWQEYYAYKESLEQGEATTSQ
ncbi:MAG: hypothetical protein HKN49_12020 [Gammaproteobacteria bacterium]|nr:hypothetical protein [Gammaproteobacteria bacterium]